VRLAEDDRGGAVGPGDLIRLLAGQTLIVVGREPAIEADAVRDHQDHVLRAQLLGMGGRDQRRRQRQRPEAVLDGQSHVRAPHWGMKATWIPMERNGSAKGGLGLVEAPDRCRKTLIMVSRKCHSVHLRADGRHQEE
jgi:hypothetical protein